MEINYVRINEMLGEQCNIYKGTRQRCVILWLNIQRMVMVWQYEYILYVFLYTDDAVLSENMYHLQQMLNKLMME